jgi:hypothetical protein
MQPGGDVKLSIAELALGSLLHAHSTLQRPECVSYQEGLVAAMQFSPARAHQLN